MVSSTTSAHIGSSRARFSAPSISSRITSNSRVLAAFTLHDLGQHGETVGTIGGGRRSSSWVMTSIMFSVRASACPDVEPFRLMFGSTSSVADFDRGALGRVCRRGIGQLDIGPHVSRREDQ